MNYIEEIRNFVPGCEQEEKDRALMLAAWETYGDAILERSCELFHLTASSMIFASSADATAISVWSRPTDAFLHPLPVRRPEHA